MKLVRSGVEIENPDLVKGGVINGCACICSTGGVQLDCDGSEFGGSDYCYYNCSGALNYAANRDLASSAYVCLE